MNNWLNAYAELLLIMRNWKGDKLADLYALVSYEMLVEMSFVDSLSQLDVATDRLNFALQNENFECECHPVTSQGSGSCLSCKIEDKVQARIEARDYLVQRGVLNDNKS